MTDLDELLKDVLPLTGQNLLDVPRDGLMVKTAVFRADLSRRPDVQAWLSQYRRDIDTQTLTAWVCRPDVDPALAVFIVTAEQPASIRFAITLSLADADGWKWIERIAMAGFIGLTDRAEARDPQDLLSRTVLIPFIAQPLYDFLEAVR